MKLKVKLLGFEAGGKPIVILNHDDSEDLGVRSLGRVRLCIDNKELTAIVHTTTKVVHKGEIGIYDEVSMLLGLKEGNEVEAAASSFPTSIHSIRNKLIGRRLNYDEIRDIITDTVKGNLSEVEITAFVIALNNYGLDLDEAAGLAMAMVETGETLNLASKTVVDKHSIGGVPGDKTTLLLVPTVAACNLTIPKSSSRAITSAAGTADRAEVLMKVDLTIEDMQQVVEKTNGCIVWGGSVHLAPADDIFVKVEYPLSIDPMLLPSIMSKKKAVGANYLVIDIPTGRGTKVKTMGDADLLAKDFIELGMRLNIRTQCAITYGEQPIGYAVGPALEAKEALEVIMGKKHTPDILDKVTHIAGIILEMQGISAGQDKALEVIKHGKAEMKLREIMAEQYGDPKVTPEDIPIGKHSMDFLSKSKGYMLWLDNIKLIELARAAGAPKDKGAGVILHKKLGNKVEIDESLLTIYAEKSPKLEMAEEMLETVKILAVGEKLEMLLSEVKEVPVHRKAFLLER